MCYNVVHLIKYGENMKKILLTLALIAVFVNATVNDYRSKYPVEVQNALKVIDKYHEKKDLVFCENINHNILKSIKHAEGYLKYKSYDAARLAAGVARSNAVDIAVMCAEKYPEYVKDAEAIIERADKVLAETKEKK